MFFNKDAWGMVAARFGNAYIRALSGYGTRFPYEARGVSISVCKAFNKIDEPENWEEIGEDLKRRVLLARESSGLVTPISGWGALVSLVAACPDEDTGKLGQWFGEVIPGVMSLEADFNLLALPLQRAVGMVASLLYRSEEPQRTYRALCEDVEFVKCRLEEECLLAPKVVDDIFRIIVEPVVRFLAVNRTAESAELFVSGFLSPLNTYIDMAERLPSEQMMYVLAEMAGHLNEGISRTDMLGVEAVYDRVQGTFGLVARQYSDSGLPVLLSMIAQGYVLEKNMALRQKERS